MDIIYTVELYQQSNQINQSLINNETGLMGCVGNLDSVVLNIGGNFDYMESQNNFNDVFGNIDRLCASKVNLLLSQHNFYKHFNYLSIFSSPKTNHISISNGFMYLSELVDLLVSKNNSVLQVLNIPLNLMNYFPLNITNSSPLLNYNDSNEIYQLNSIEQWFEFCNLLKSNTGLVKLTLSNCCEHQVVDDKYFLGNPSYKSKLLESIYEYYGKDYCGEATLENRDINMDINRDQLYNYIYGYYNYSSESTNFKIYYDDNDLKSIKENQSNSELQNLINRKDQITQNLNQSNIQSINKIKLNKYVMANNIFHNQDIGIEKSSSNHEDNGDLRENDIPFNLLEYFKIRDLMRNEFASIWKFNNTITHLEINNLQIISKQFFLEMANNNKSITDLILNCNEFSFNSNQRYFTDIVNSFCEMINNNKTLRNLTITSGSFIFTNLDLIKSIQSNKSINIKIYKS